MRIYTDASTRGRLSGIAFVATDARDRELYKKGTVIEQRDNNTAELCAVLFALEDIQYLEIKHVTIFTDSWYVINAVRNGVRRENEKQLVKKIRQHMSEINSSLMWIKGHYRDGTVLSYYNKRADKMSKVVRRQYEKQLVAEKRAKTKFIRRYGKSR
ncbi:reverse transcriptase-like protein [bacterium]|nr:reverse transcriptase-like protein [bacterium]MBR2273270.1 reverse transcriptase-like protein [Alphaproteobacteria bacterium]